ncbi:MAG: ArnT family glycosyltransferase [Chloroflexia bacterium]
MIRPLAGSAKLDVLAVTLAACIYLGLTTYQLTLPGLYYDEAWDAVSTMHIVQNVPVELERGAHLSLLGRDWPLMLDDYQGTVSTYMLVPFFLLGGINVASLRAFPILSGLIALILCYFLARAWFGRATARLAVLLFAVSTSWVFWSRIGVYVVAEVVPLTLGALLAFTCWWRSSERPAWLLGLGSLLLGVGLSTKLLYVWPILAIGVCFVLLRPGSLRHAPLRVHALQLLLALACFGAGAFPFLAYNWQTHGTYLEIRSRLTGTEYGANNTTVLPNLWEEADRYRQLLDGGYFWFQGEAANPGDQGRVYKDPLAGAAFVLAALGLLAAAIRALPQGRADELPTLRSALRTPHSALRNREGRLLLLAAGGMASGLLVDVAALALPNAHGGKWQVFGLLAVLITIGAGGALVRAGLLKPGAWALLAGWTLLGMMAVSGATWFLVGQYVALAGRHIAGPLDLRLSDMAGVLFWFCLFALLLLLGWSAPASRLQRPLVAALGYLAAVLAQSFPTLSGLWATHLLVMLPMPQIVVAAAIAGVGQYVAPAGRHITGIVPPHSALRTPHSALRWWLLRRSPCLGAQG